MNPEDKNKVETILFTTGKYLTLEEISKMTGIASVGYLQEVIHALQQDYAQRASALEITEQGNQWKLSIRKPYLPFTEKLLNDSDLDRPTQETLAIIAYKNPVLQSDVIKIRGTKAYDHIHTLKELEFITVEKSGRTRLVKVTSKFYDYFDVMEDALKSKFSTLNQKEDDKLKTDVATLFGNQPEPTTEQQTIIPPISETPEPKQNQ